MEISVYYRNVRRSRFYFNVACIFGSALASYYGVRIHRGPRQPHGHGQGARYTGTEGHEMASHEVDQHSRQLFADDVLHNDRRMDDPVFCEDGNGTV